MKSHIDLSNKSFEIFFIDRLREPFKFSTANVSKVEEQDEQIKNLQKQLKEAEALLANTIYQAKQGSYLFYLKKKITKMKEKNVDNIKGFDLMK